MDKIKVYLAATLTYGFWVLCGSLILVPFIIWFLVTWSLSSDTQAQISKLKQYFNNGRQVTVSGQKFVDAPIHPNLSTNKLTEANIEITRKSVYDSWELQYQNQGAEIFVWPEQLPQDFRDHVKALRPIESKVMFPIQADKSVDLSTNMKTDYRDYILAEMPKLADIIHAKWSGSAEAAGSQRGGMQSRPGGFQDPNGTGSEADRPVVEWSQESQNQIASLFDWSKQIPNFPSTLQVLYAQEDIWVLTTMMNVIKATNLVDGVYPDENRKAIIKQLISIQIGKDAAEKSGQVMVVKSAEDKLGGMNPDMGTMDPSAREPSAMDKRVDDKKPVDPAEGRYVDKTYQPLLASKLRAGLNTSGSGSGDTNSELLLTVAKRIPVRFKVKMDHRQLSKLLANCSNSPLTVEVRQVRILGEGMANSSRRQVISGGNQMMDQNKKGGGSDYDRMIEIYGIIYIYNPPPKVSQDINKTAQDGAKTAQDGS